MDTSPEIQTSIPVEGTSVTYWEAFKVWLEVAAFSFGGPTAPIAVMHRILVDDKRVPQTGFREEFSLLF